MLKLKLLDNTELNVNASHVVTFYPDKAGSVVHVSTGSSIGVSDSCRTIRHQMKKAQAGASEAE